MTPKKGIVSNTQHFSTEQKVRKDADEEALIEVMEETEFEVDNDTMRSKPSMEELVILMLEKFSKVQTENSSLKEISPPERLLDFIDSISFLKKAEIYINHMINLNGRSNDRRTSEICALRLAYLIGNIL